MSTFGGVIAILSYGPDKVSLPKNKWANKNKNRFIYRKQTGGCKGDEDKGWMKLVKGIKKYKVQVIKYVSHRDEMYGIGI